MLTEYREHATQQLSAPERTQFPPSGTNPLILDEPQGSGPLEMMMSIDERQVAAELVEPSSVAEERAESVDGFPLMLEETDFHPLPSALPVDGLERVNSVDVIRGVALMGILAMNIVNFGWPGMVYKIPIMAPEYGQGDLILWGVNHLIFEPR